MAKKNLKSLKKVTRLKSLLEIKKMSKKLSWFKQLGEDPFDLLEDKK